MRTLSKIALACLPLLAVEARAHALWAEPAQGGYKIYFGEPGEGLHEKKEKFADVGPIKAWDAAGKEVKGTQAEDHVFVPAPAGTFTASASEVPLHGKGDDALRVFFYARSADPGRKLAPTKGAALEILPEGKDSVSFSVVKDGKPLTEGSLQMFAPGGWNRSFKLDAQGKVRLETPWPGRYVLEASSMDKIPGKVGDKAYTGTYHAATFSFTMK
jgi:hypothetical protein